jgi:hypothetical protein
MLTVKLLQKDYEYLAKCMVPLGAQQANMTLQERADMLRGRTRRFPKTRVPSTAFPAEDSILVSWYLT